MQSKFQWLFLILNFNVSVKTKKINETLKWKANVYPKFSAKQAYSHEPSLPLSATYITKLTKLVLPFYSKHNE